MNFSHADHLMERNTFVTRASNIYKKHNSFSWELLKCKYLYLERNMVGAFLSESVIGHARWIMFFLKNACCGRLMSSFKKWGEKRKKDH